MHLQPLTTSTRPHPTTLPLLAPLRLVPPVTHPPTTRTRIMRRPLNITLRPRISMPLPRIIMPHLLQDILRPPPRHTGTPGLTRTRHTDPSKCCLLSPLIDSFFIHLGLFQQPFSIKEFPVAAPRCRDTWDLIHDSMGWPGWRRDRCDEIAQWLKRLAQDREILS